MPKKKRKPPYSDENQPTAEDVGKRMSDATSARNDAFNFAADMVKRHETVRAFFEPPKKKKKKQ